jgi:hypothetical protein
MAQSYDGTFSAAIQHGAKQISLPLQSEGNYFATLVRRNYLAAPATAYAPVIGTLTNYTNRLTYSDDLSNAAWVKAQATGTASAASDPEGATTATKLAEDNTNNVHTATQAMTVASGAVAFGLLAKASERSFVRLRVNNGTDGNLAIAVFNLSTGVVVSGTGTIKRLLNGWFWCSVTGTATIANSSAIIDLSTDGTTFSYLGTTGSGVLLWRATAYLASAAGPLVATTSATRAVTAPPIDADDPLAFLVMEQEPDSSSLEIGVVRWSREYANVPAPVITYSTIAISLPTAAAAGGISGASQFFYTNLGGASLLGMYVNYLTYIFAPNNKVYGPLKTGTSVDSGANTRLTITGHGLAGTETIIAAGVAASTGRYGIVLPAGYTVIDPNTIDILGYNLGVFAQSIAVFLRNYTPGVVRVRTRNTSTFYLPGFTLGINSVDDIPIPSPAINDTQLLALIIGSATGYQTYDADPIAFYRAPIYVQRVIAINVDSL